MSFKQTLLDQTAQKVKNCQKCSLCKTATNPVPGNGDPEAEIMFIGEAPGYWEDQKGIPFCGAAGKLLDELLASIGLDRAKVFVANVLKHRPPNNRDPLPEEIQACQEYLDEQIKIIQPKTIITLGRFSLAKFLPEAKISKDHGKPTIVNFKGLRIILIPMFHPAAALRSAEIEQKLRNDFKKIPEEIKKMSQVLGNSIPETQISEKPKEEQLKLV